MDDYRDTAKCSACGHWSPVGNPCYKCGSALELDSDEMYRNKGIVTCGYCGHWALAKSECAYCGAPVDPPTDDFYMNYEPEMSTPYFANGGVSVGGKYNTAWLLNGDLDE